MSESNPAAVALACRRMANIIKALKDHDWLIKAELPCWVGDASVLPDDVPDDEVQSYTEQKIASIEREKQRVLLRSPRIQKRLWDRMQQPGWLVYNASESWNMPVTDLPEFLAARRWGMHGFIKLHLDRILVEAEKRAHASPATKPPLIDAAHEQHTPIKESGTDSTEHPPAKGSSKEMSAREWAKSVGVTPGQASRWRNGEVKSITLTAFTPATADEHRRRVADARDVKTSKQGVPLPAKIESLPTYRCKECRLEYQAKTKRACRNCETVQHIELIQQNMK